MRIETTQSRFPKATGARLCKPEPVIHSRLPVLAWGAKIIVYFQRETNGDALLNYLH